MTISRPSSGGTAVTAASAATSQNITIPSVVQGGDTVLLAYNCNPGTGTPSLPAAPGGSFSLVLSFDYSTSTRLYLWSYTAAGSTGATSSDAGGTITITNSASQRTASLIEVYRGVGGIINATGKAETSAVSSHVVAGPTASASCWPVLFGAERAPTTPSTTVTQQSGWTRWNNAWGTGSGAAGIFAGDGQALIASGATIAGGTWACDQPNINFVSIAIGLTPMGAVVNAGTDQTVAKGSTVSVTASESGVSGTPTRAWTQVSGPTVSLSGASTASATFTASTAGIVVLQYALTDTNGTATDQVQINVTDTNPRPVSVIGGDWLAVGSGSPTVASVMADEDDTTLAQSPAAPNGDYAEVLFAPAASVPLAVTYNLDENATGKTITVLVELRQGAGVIASWTETLTTSVQVLTRALTSTQQGNITNLLDLRLRFTATAT